MLPRYCFWLHISRFYFWLFSGFSLVDRGQCPFRDNKETSGPYCCLPKCTQAKTRTVFPTNLYYVVAILHQRKTPFPCRILLDFWFIHIPRIFTSEFLKRSLSLFSTAWNPLWGLLWLNFDITFFLFFGNFLPKSTTETELSKGFFTWFKFHPNTDLILNPYYS